jgi:hypothetical protein
VQKEAAAMMKKRSGALILVSVLLILAVMFGVWFIANRHPKSMNAGAQRPRNSTVGAVGNEQPVRPEKNPPGDIPDSQVFIRFISTAGGYELQVPEGWARTTRGADVGFVDKFDGLKVEVGKTAVAPTVDNVRQNQMQTPRKIGRAVKFTGVGAQRLANAAAVVLSFESNSAPDSVTGKQIRLENMRYLFYKDGKLAALTLWAPLGADNVDQWRLISNSFRWR